MRLKCWTVIEESYSGNKDADSFFQKEAAQVFMKAQAQENEDFYSEQGYEMERNETELSISLHTEPFYIWHDWEIIESYVE